MRGAEKPGLEGGLGSHQCGRDKALTLGTLVPLPDHQSSWKVVRKPLTTESPAILRTERTAALSPETRLGSVPNAGTLTLHRQGLCMLGVSGEGDGEVGGGEGHLVEVSLSNPVRRPHGEHLHPHPTPLPSRRVTTCGLTAIGTFFQSPYRHPPAPPLYTLCQ